MKKGSSKFETREQLELRAYEQQEILIKIAEYIRLQKALGPARGDSRDGIISYLSGILEKSGLKRMSKKGERE